MRLPTWLYLLVFVGLVALNVSLYRELLAPPALRVTVLPVGEKGRALLVQSPDGKTVLVDTGRDASILRALGEVLPMWKRRLDAVILTNATPGTTGGLPDVQNRYAVSSLIRSLTRGKRLALGGGAFIDVLWPPETTTPLNTTNRIIILRLSYGTTSILIQNDLPPRISKYLATLDTHLPAPDLIISSTTPAGVYISNGGTVTMMR